MKKGFITLVTTAALYLSSALPVHAQISLCPTNRAGANFGGLCQVANANLSNVVQNILVIILIIAVLLSLFFLIFGGIKWIFSGGDKSGVEAARNMIIAAIVGLVIAFLAFLIIQIIGRVFGVSLNNIDSAINGVFLNTQ